MPDTDAAVAFRLKFVRQEERKKVTFGYHRSEAVRRVYAPQGFLGLLLADLEDAERLFEELDLDDEFFREMTVTASTATDFAPIGLSRAQVTIDYGDPAVPADHKHHELTLTPEDHAPKQATFFLGSTRAVDFDARIRYDFAPQSGWAADRSSYEVLLVDTVNRDLVLNPFDTVEFRTITVQPGVVDWEVVGSLEVRLQGHGYGDPEPRGLVTVTEQSGPQTFRVRGALPAPAGRGITATVTQVLKDGQQATADPVEVTDDVVNVHDLMEAALDLVFVPQWDAAAVTTAFLDVEYRDDANAYTRSVREEVPGDRTEPVRVHLALRDGAVRDYRYRLTLSGPGLFDQRAFVDTSETLVALQ